MTIFSEDDLRRWARGQPTHSELFTSEKIAGVAEALIRRLGSCALDGEVAELCDLAGALDLLASAYERFHGVESDSIPLDEDDDECP